MVNVIKVEDFPLKKEEDGGDEVGGAGRTVTGSVTYEEVVNLPVKIEARAMDLGSVDFCTPCKEEEEEGGRLVVRYGEGDGKGNVDEGSGDQNEEISEQDSEVEGKVEEEKKFACGEEGCGYKVKLRGNLKQHLAHVHDIGVVWFKCTQEGCEYKAKERGNLKLHLAHVHDIGVVWLKCTQAGCDCKAKQRGDIKKHLAHVHDIGVRWHKCTQEGCGYKAKQRGHLKRHLKNVHHKL
jgi:hypothetical protein